MPTLIESTLNVVVELRPGVRVVASWTGRGRCVTIHAVDAGGRGLAIDSMPAWDDAHGRPAIEATLPALESFVVERLLADAAAVELLADLAEDVATWDDCDEIVVASAN